MVTTSRSPELAHVGWTHLASTEEGISKRLETAFWGQSLGAQIQLSLKPPASWM